MSRLTRRRLSIITAAACAVLVLPAAAQAAEYTVSPGQGACGGGDTACGGLAEAAAAAAAGDVFNVAPGTYPGANFSVGGVTINGQAGAVVDGTLELSGAAGGTSKVAKVSVVKTAPAGPGILVDGAAGAIIEDCVVVSRDGDGIHISAGTTNKIVRTLAATGGAGTSAVRVVSTTGTPNKALTLESVMLIGGGSGLGAFTTAAELEAAPGDIAITARHITAAGSANGILLDSSGARRLAIATGVGNIVANVTDSITFQNATRNFPGTLGIGNIIGGNNTATINAARTLTSGDKGAIFANAPANNFRLRPNSPVIGQGAVEAGESTTDIDGEDRAGAPTDLGADEYNNAPPVARISVKTNPPRAGQPVTFDGSASVDREQSYGGGIVKYKWSFSDGTNEETTAPTINHVFANEGDATASLVVVDNVGASSPAATVSLKLTDGTPPVVAIVKPKNKQTIRRFTTKKTTRTVNGKKVTTTTRKRTKIVFAGLSRDPSGVTRVILTLEKLATTSGSSAQASQTTTPKCNWFDPARGIRRRSCAKPVLLFARLIKDSKTGEWTYTVKRNLGVGRYRLTAFGVDGSGAVGNSGGSKVGQIRFTVK